MDVFLNAITNSGNSIVGNSNLITKVYFPQMSALNVKYRDIRHALPFLIQLGLFVSPIIYPLTFVREKWRWLLVFNQLTGIIEGYRSAIFDRSFDWFALGISTLITFAVLFYAAYMFKRMEKTFADII